MATPNLNKFMKKKGIEKAPEWESSEVPGHGDISTDDFETADTKNDPLDDGTDEPAGEDTGPESKKAMSNLDKYEKMKKK